MTTDLLKLPWVVATPATPATVNAGSLADLDRQIAALNAKLDDLRQTPNVNPAPGWTGYAYPGTNTDVEPYEYIIRRECSADRGTLLNG